MTNFVLYQKRLGEQNTIRADRKTLANFVQKQLNDRGTFDTDVCQYAFGLNTTDELPLEEPFSPLSEPAMLKDNKNNGLSIKFPNSGCGSYKFPSPAKKSLADAVTNRTSDHMAETAKSGGTASRQRGFGLRISV